MTYIPKTTQESALDCVKAPAARVPEVGPYLEHRAHLRESQPRGFHAVQSRFLSRFRYKSFIRYCFIGCILVSATAYPKQHIASLEKAAEYSQSSLCFFTPPAGWDIADPRSLSPRVKIAFLKSTSNGFCPSINLAVEETSVSLNEYLKAVKMIHEQDRSNHWRALGKVKTNAGLAQLTEIDSKTEWGAIRILQLIFLKDGQAYVITASALREEFSNYYKEIQSAFRSLTLSSDLIGNIPQTERREMLKAKQHQLIHAAQEMLTSSKDSKNLLEDSHFQEKHWIPFQQAVLSSFNDMGAFWQVLILRSAQEKLLSLSPPEVPSIPKVSQKSDLGCVKAPAVEFPQVGPYYEHRTHLRELNRGSFHAAQDQLLKHFRYNDKL